MKLSTLETVFNSLNQAKVRYLVAGGIAVNIDDIEHLQLILDESK